MTSKSPANSLSRRALLGMLVSAGALPVARAQAPDWPARPIQLLIPYPPGGSADLLARPLSAVLQGLLGQSVVLDYRPGAGGTLASALLTHAKPDGYTLILVLAAHAINHTLYPKLPYDTRRDFAPVSGVANQSFVLAASAALKARNVQELLQQAKDRPGQLRFASAGIGNTGHLAAELFAAAAGVQFSHVPYKGSAAVVNAPLAGEVEFAFDTLSTAMPHVHSGRLRALATSGAQRSVLAPDLPTVEQAGVPGYAVHGWYAVMAPAATPAAIRERLSRAIASALTQAQLQKQLHAGGYELVGSTPAELALHIESEIERWAQAVRLSGAKVL